MNFVVIFQVAPLFVDLHKKKLAFLLVVLQQLILPVLLHHSSVTAISTIQMNLPSHNLVKDENIKQVEMLYNEIMKRFGSNGDKLPILDPLEDMEIEDKQLQELIAAKNKIAKELEKIEMKA